MSVVLDVSALLAFLQDEPGASVVDDLLDESLISSVNWSDVIQRALARGVPTEGLRADLEALSLEIAAFTSEHVKRATMIWGETRRMGLSLADCACLALGLESGLPVYTADRSWSKLKLGLEVRVVK